MSIYVSQYLNIYPSNGGGDILFHGVTGAIDEVGKKLSILLRLNKRNKSSLYNKVPRNVLSFLLGRGHLTKYKPDEEYENAKHVYTKLHNEVMKEREKSGLLTLMPGYDCNLACPYCYQCKVRSNLSGNLNDTMSPATIDMIFDKALGNLFPKVERPSKIQISLYGGEPFLQKHKKAIDRIIEHTRRHQMGVFAVTNAATIQNFIDFVGNEKGLVNWVQISFDGEKKHHDNSRITVKGEGTFSRIIKNIHRLIDKGVKVTIRINTSINSMTGLKSLEETLVQEEILGHPQVSIYAAAIHGHYDYDNAFNEFVSEIKLSQYIRENDLKINSTLSRTKRRLSNLFYTNLKYPLRRTQFCMQNNVHSYVIDPFKKIYGCHEDSGKPDLAIGSIFDDGRVVLTDRYRMYQNRYLSNIHKCSRCPIGLTCGGGCATCARGKDLSPKSIYKNYCNSQREIVATAIMELFDENKVGILDKLDNTDNDQYNSINQLLHL